MKSIQNQYNDLKEGKMSQANFIRNIRMTFPQYVTNVTSLNDSIKILKNKGILSESFTTFQPEEKTMGEMNMDVKPEESNDDAEFDAMLKQLEDEMAGEIAVKSDVLDEPLEEDEQLNEGKGKELHPNAIHPGELRMGIRVEMEHTDNIDKAKKIALDHLAENPFYYTALKLAGVESPSAPKVKAPKEVKEKKAKDATDLVDKANQMQKVKMPKKVEEKKKIKENVDEKMRFQDLPADPEKYKMVKDSKGKIIKATNADGVEFQRGDVAKAYDGEEIKIADFKEEQGKVKALYNKGMFFASIDIDGLEAGKPTFRPGVNMGGSMEKLKNMVREIMKEMESNDQEIDDMAMVMDEYFDGRDNLDAENEVN